MEQTKYTVFSKEAHGFMYLDNQFSYSGVSSLQELIDIYVREFNATPVAWATELAARDKGCDALCAESIAAGRTIDYIGGRYVPRGVQEDKPKEGEDFPRTLSDFLYRARMIPPFSVRVGATEKKHPRLTWADSKPADRWEGFTVKSNPGPQSEQTKGPLSLSTNTNVVQLPAVCGSGHVALGKG